LRHARNPDTFTASGVTPYARTMHILPTPEAFAAFAQRGLSGPIRMLNLLRFRDVADYSASPDLAPDEPISGADAYQIYSVHTMPLLAEVGGKAIFMDAGGPLLIGPVEERWDQVLIIEYPDVAAFVTMTQNPKYGAGAGHRTAALADSRLLPMQ
jgi:uncharacterized protein (DUF1330 family)